MSYSCGTFDQFNKYFTNRHLVLLFIYLFTKVHFYTYLVHIFAWVHMYMTNYLIRYT